MARIVKLRPLGESQCCQPSVTDKLVTKWTLEFFIFLDSDGNGAIDFPEFLALMTKNLEECDPEDILQESFKVFDRDGSGFIGVSELDRVFKLLGQEFKDYEIEAMIKAADADGDGLVGYDDFMKMMNVWIDWFRLTVRFDRLLISPYKYDIQKQTKTKTWWESKFIRLTRFDVEWDSQN